MENYIADRPVQASRSMKNIQRITFLWTQRNGINNRRVCVFSFQPPLMIVEMEDMGFFDSTVNQTYFRRVSHIRPQNRRCRVSVYPGTHGNVFSGIRMLLREWQAVSHRL